MNLQPKEPSMPTQLEICSICNSPQLVLPDGTHACHYTKSLLAYHEGIINRKWEAVFKEHTDTPPLNPEMAAEFLGNLYDKLCDLQSEISGLKWDLHVKEESA